jgi:hypothetical protein
MCVCACAEPAELRSDQSAGVNECVPFRADGRGPPRLPTFANAALFDESRSHVWDVARPEDARVDRAWRRVSSL